MQTGLHLTDETITFMAPAAIKISGLTRRYGTAKVLDVAGFSVEPGRATVLLGPAGCGKSTLIRILAGFEQASAGKVELDGKPFGRLAAHRRSFGVVQQTDHLFAHLTLAQNVALPLRLRRVARSARNGLVQAALEMVQLQDQGELMPHAATPAQRQRAALARATIFGPRLLLLDEVLANQGPDRLAMLGSLRRVQDMLGITTILATQNGADALAVGDRIAVLRGGVLEQEGTPEEVFDRPRNDFVAALFGETNRLPGVVQSTDMDIAVICLACGPVVEAQCGPRLEAGDPCMLMLRPDRIAFASVSAAEMGEGALDATVLDTEFHGDFYRVRLLIGSGAELFVRRPTAAGLRGLTPGQAGAIAWQPYHASAFRID